MTEMKSRGAVPEITLGDRLGIALKYAGIGVQDMAAYLGVSRNTISNYTGGHTHADKRTLMLWAMRTGVDLEWLQTGHAPTAPPTPPGGERPVAQTSSLAELTEAKRARSRRGGSTGRYFTRAA